VCVCVGMCLTVECVCWSVYSYINNNSFNQSILDNIIISSCHRLHFVTIKTNQYHYEIYLQLMLNLSTIYLYNISTLCSFMLEVYVCAHTHRDRHTETHTLRWIHRRSLVNTLCTWMNPYAMLVYLNLHTLSPMNTIINTQIYHISHINSLKFFWCSF